MKYSFHPWHSYYLVRAQQEISNLKKLFPNTTIEHFGSTAVPKLGGKGIIDISISVAPDNIESTFQIIKNTAYDYHPTGGVPEERMFFQKTIKYDFHHKQLFHLHLTKNGNENMIECLAFRDFLISHPALANEYSNIKRQAVLSANKYHNKADKKKAYMETKKPTIEKILREMKNRL